MVVRMSIDEGGGKEKEDKDTEEEEEGVWVGV